MKHGIKGALDKFNIIPQLFPKKKVGIFIPLELLAWVMTACRVLRSRLTYFWRYMNISSIFYFSKSTSINTQYSSLWDTLKMMLFTKYLIKWKLISRISKKIDARLVQCPFKVLVGLAVLELLIKLLWSKQYFAWFDQYIKLLGLLKLQLRRFVYKTLFIYLFTYLFIYLFIFKSVDNFK